MSRIESRFFAKQWRDSTGVYGLAVIN